MNRCITVAMLAGLALSPVAAIGQVTIVSSSRSIHAQAGDGSGTNQATAPNNNAWNQTVTKSFTNGNASAHQNSGMGAWSIFSSVDCHSFAQSQNEAGSADSDFTVQFDAAQPFLVDCTAFGSGGGNGSVDFRLKNRATNATIFAGDGIRHQVIPAGQYQIDQSVFCSYGDKGATLSFTIRPGNDECNHAFAVNPGVYEMDTDNATGEGATSSCNNPAQSHDIWYTYTAIHNGVLHLTTCGSDFDTVLTVYTNNCVPDQNDEIACNDDAAIGPCSGPGARQSAVDVNVVDGTDYLIRVHGYNGATGHAVLNVGPVNDDCVTAQVVSTGSYPFDNRLASTNGPILADCTNGGLDNQIHGDLWYSYTPAASGFVSVDTCGSGFDTKIAVYSGLPCEGRSTFIDCNDDSCGLQSRIQNIPVSGGHTYAIRVGGYLTERGTGTLHVNFTPPCPADFNDDGFLDFFDIDAFVDCFENSNCPPGKSADFNGDQFVDFFDIDAFIAAFENGC